MNDFNKYRDYEPSDFLLDEDFVDWVQSNDPVKHAYWNEVATTYPHLDNKIQKARELISLLDSPEPKISESIKDRIWNTIAGSTSGGKMVNIRRRSRWMVAAAILVLIAGTTIVWQMGQQEEKLFAANENSQLLPNNDVAPGGNKAILTLADGSKIVLDSVNNGAITKQGNVTVIKLNNGLLSYDSSTSTLNPQSSTIKYNTITTPRGGQYRLVLADGTKVWLNAASSLKYPTSFSGNERRVEITGEAYFEVAHDAAHPFYVEIVSNHAYSGTEIKVLGTRFNINTYSDENLLKASLLQGAIQISNEDNEEVLQPGQQAVIKNNEKVIAVKNDVNMEQVIAWKNGYFQFDNFTIQQIMRQLARWYNVEVVYDGDIPGGHFVGKPSRNLNLSEILQVIEYSGVQLQIEGDKVIVGNQT